MSKLEQKIITGIDLAALTAHLHLQGKTEEIRDRDGHIVVPTEADWRKLQL